MFVYLGRIVVEEPDDRLRNPVAAAGDSLAQFAADVRQTVLQEIVVRIVQIAQKRFEGDVPAIDGRRAFVVEQIDHGKERRRVDAALATHFVHRAVAEPQSDTEPAHDEQDMVIAAYQIAHPVRSRIFPEPVHNGISFRSLQR